MFFTLIIGIALVIAVAPLIIIIRFTSTTPTRLLGAKTITFPRLKRSIMLIQLGISIFLIVASMVIKRQINYSLLKEPGRNHDQVVYVDYPKGLTDEGLSGLRRAWKEMNPNILDVMATSRLPGNLSSKELNSQFYFMTVDRGFKDFFNLEMVKGNWFGANAGDSIFIVNEEGSKRLDTHSNLIGVFKDFGNQFNQPEKPLKINVAPYYSYNFLCIRILEVDIQKTIQFLEHYFKNEEQRASVSFLNKHFEEWLHYQHRLNILSEALAIISVLLSCIAIYGLSISIVRDKIKQIAIHKLWGAGTYTITRLLIKEFVLQLVFAIAIFGPMTYLILQEVLRTFVYSTPFIWLDPFLPLAYCVVVILLLCMFQTLSLNRKDLTSA
jgi:ABC-type antimicrobial peptide transport system permease subunit